MSKKKNKQKAMLKSLRDLGQNGRETLSRLATTVKADVPTVIMGDSAKADGMPAFGLKRPETTRVSRIVNKLNPFHRDQEALSAKKLKKLAKQIAAGNPALPKPRRSRLPLVVAICAAIIGGGGYYAYQSINLSDIKVSEYVDYEGWLATASGAKPQTKSTWNTTSSSSNRSSYQAPKAYKPAPKVVEKKFRALPKTAKKQIWQDRLAKAKAQSAAKYKNNAYKKKSTAYKGSKAKLTKSSASKRKHLTSAKSSGR